MVLKGECLGRGAKKIENLKTKMENSKNKQILSLGVNKMGRNIKKIPMDHLNYGSSSRSQQPDSPIHIISKENFKSFVQQATGSPNHPPNRPSNNTQISSITRLQRFRPPPLSLIVRPAFQIPTPVPISFAMSAPVSIPTAPPPAIVDFPGLTNGFKEPSPNHLQPSTIPSQSSMIAPTSVAPQASTVALPWEISSDDLVESPMSAFVRQFLEDPDSNGDQFQLQPQPQEVASSVRPWCPQTQIQSQYHSSNVIAPLLSENFTIANPIVSVNANNSVQFEPNGTTIDSLMPMNVNVDLSATTNSLVPINVSSNQLDFTNIPFPSPNEPLFPFDIQFPCPPSPPLFPPDYEFPTPQSPDGPPEYPPSDSPSVFFPISPSGIFPMPPWKPGQI